MLRASNTLVQNFTYVSCLDEAVDSDAPEFDEKWKLYLDGAADPPLKPGGKPTVFKLKHLSAVERDRLSPFLSQAIGDSDVYGRQACFAACALGLVGAEDWLGTDGKPLAVEHELDAKLHGVSVVTAKTMNALGLDVALELGSRVLARLQPSPK